MEKLQYQHKKGILKLLLSTKTHRLNDQTRKCTVKTLKTLAKIIYFMYDTILTTKFKLIHRYTKHKRNNYWQV